MSWHERPNRVLLVNLREGDEPKIDAKALVDDVKSFGATAFCINGGGIVAFYQTKIPGHRISSGLGSRDLLAEGLHYRVRQPYEPFRMWIRKRTNQYCIHNAEDGRV